MLDKRQCVGCSACIHVCTHKAIKFAEDEGGFLYPVIDQKKCVNCGLCEHVCPTTHLENMGKLLYVYAAINLSYDIRSRSTSGGMFHVFADYVLSNDGLVCGCVMDDDGKGCHLVLTDDRSLLEKMLGSKYIQAKTLNTFVEVKNALVSQRKVLFCGTPCQVAGLKSFLKKPYANLLCIDFICHGVGAPAVWKAYANYRERIEGSEIQKVSFRDKSEDGWRNYNLSIQYANGCRYSDTKADDPYMKGFLQDLYLRESCYQCLFKRNNYCSDITLADCWGIEAFAPELDDDKGASLIVCHTLKGGEILSAVSGRMLKKSISQDIAFHRNKSYYQHVFDNLWRKRAIHQLVNKENFPQILDKYCGSGIGAKIRRKLSKYARKMR